MKRNFKTLPVAIFNSQAIAINSCWFQCHEQFCHRNHSESLKRWGMPRPAILFSFWRTVSLLWWPPTSQANSPGNYAFKTKTVVQLKRHLRPCRWSKFCPSPALVSGTGSSPLKWGEKPAAITENNSSQKIKTSATKQVYKIAYRPSDDSWVHIALCLDSPTLWEFLQHPFQALSACHRHQSSIFLCPEKSHRSIFLQQQTHSRNARQTDVENHKLAQNALFSVVQYQPISFFSWMNFTFANASDANSIAWLNPFSPPYETSTILMTFACNLCK